VSPISRSSLPLSPAVIGSEGAVAAAAAAVAAPNPDPESDSAIVGA
jgi:hypothetical protein